MAGVFSIEYICAAGMIYKCSRNLRQGKLCFQIVTFLLLLDLGRILTYPLTRSSNDPILLLASHISDCQIHLHPPRSKKTPPSQKHHHVSLFSSRRLHPNMLIRHPKHDLLVRTRTHVVSRIPLDDARPAPTGQAAQGSELLGLNLDLAVRVPGDEIALPAAAADEIASVGAEGDVPLAQLAGHARCGAEVEGRVDCAGQVCAEGAVEGVEEEVACWGVGGEKEGFAVVGEVQLRPVWVDEIGGGHVPA